MKKPFLLVAIIIISGYCSFAGIVTQQKAQAIALNFFKVNYPAAAAHQPLTATLKYTQSEADNSIDFYVFDISPAHGFVIVAADDIIIPILAYSNETYFNTQFRFTGVQSWIDKTSTNIHRAVQQQLTAAPKVVNLWNAYTQGVNPVNTKSTTVGPLCATTWDQENDITNPPPYLYNLFCPYNATDKQRCLTGCVATAQAQIMKFWNYPAVGTDSFSYVDNTANGYSYNYGPQSSNFAAHAYKWNIMPNELTGTEPAADDTAVDVLMYDCAVSVGMDFGDDNQDGSGANALLAEELPYDSFCTQYALIKYFWYNADTIQGVFKDNFTDSAWTTIIEHQLNMGRPVIYEGNDTTQGGHAWVCDGYDASDKLHMNWGWSGFDDGYFTVTNLTTEGNFNPILEDDALIGILPRQWDTVVPQFRAEFTTTCSGAVQFQNTSKGQPTYSFWDFGDGATSKLQNPVHTYAANGTYTVTLNAGNPGNITAKTITDYVTVNRLAAPSVGNVSASAPQSFTLTAATDYTVAWYDAAGNYLTSANPFVTPVINTTTVYYVEDSVVSPSAHVGAANNQVGGVSAVSDSFALKFNVLGSCIIQSVYVYAANAGPCTIQIVDSSGNVLGQQTVNCAAGGSRVAVNFNLDAGGPYFMQVAGNFGLLSDSTGAAYPYADTAGLVSITGNTYGSSAYLYFYDWIVKAPDCVSPRVPVTASILPATAISSPDDAIRFTMFPNPAANQVTVQFDNLNQPTSLNLTNILGQTVISKNVTDQQTTIDLSALANGVYLMQLRQGEKFTVKQLVVAR